MIDIYLIFSLMIPFVEVLLQTYMDSLRLENDEYDADAEKESKLRTINHHGRAITVAQNGVRIRNNKNSWMTGIFNNGYATDEVIPTVTEAMKGQKVNKMDLLNRNEQLEVEARENLYKGASSQNGRLKLCVYFAKKGIPMISICFQFCYWSIGLIHIYSIYSIE